MSGLTQALGYEQNVKAGICDIAEAPVGTAYSNSAGLWAPVGILEPGSFKSDFSRKFFDFVAGIPETIQASFVTGLTGKLDFGLVEITGNALRMAAGGVEPIRTYAASNPTPTTVTASPAQSTTAGVTTFAVTSSTGFTVGMEIEIGTTINSVAALEYATITSVATGQLSVMPQLIGTATATTGTIKAVTVTRIPAGTSTIRNMSYRMVFNAVDGSQVVIHVLKGRASGLKPEFPQGKNAIIPITIEAYGIKDATLSPPQPVVAQLYYLPPGFTI